MKKLLVISLIILVEVTSLPITALAQEIATSEATASESAKTPLEKLIENTTGAIVVDPALKTIVENQDAVVPTPTLSEIEKASSATLRRKLQMRSLFKKFFKMTEPVSLVVDNADDSSLSTTILDPKGKKILLAVREIVTGASRVFRIMPPAHLRPGVYTVQTSDTTGQKVTQDFTWGVLALNTNKSIYQPGEEAHIALAVLNEKGEMECNASIELRIKNQGLRIDDTLSTENGKILVNPECRIHDKTEKPDYEAVYTVGGAGEYQMELSAVMSSGTDTIDDSFQVKDTVPFIVERQTATRIFPQKPYEVTTTITANQDFSGVVTDIVPKSFSVVTDQDANNKASEKNVLGADSRIEVLSAATSNLRMPFDGSHKVSLGFGEQIQDENEKRTYEKFGLAGHDGIDFDMPIGTPVLAADDGQIVLAEPSDYGLTVVIQHSWGKTYYGHLNSLALKKGDTVHKGDKIALSGNTGLTTGSHLHFGIKPNVFDAKNGYFGKINPAPYLGITDTTSDLYDVKFISWNVTLKKGENITLSYTYDAPDESPQFYTIGPLAFHASASSAQVQEQIVFEEARVWQLAVDAPNGNGMLTYDTDAANAETPHSRTWAPSDLSAEANMQADGTLFEDVNHTIIKAAPTRNEYIRASLDASGTLDVEIFNGTSWSFGSGAPAEGRFTTGIGTTDDVNRNFDVAYEHTSGDAMVVYEDSATDDKTLKYRTWNGSTWSSEQTLDYSAVAEGGSNDEAEWVEMKSRSVSSADEIMLGWKDMTGDGVYGAVWDGGAWQDISLINGAGINTNRRSFDVVWEGTSDQGMLVYGTGTTTDYSVYDISGSAWTDGSGSSSPGEAVDWLNLSGDGATDYVAMIITSGASTTTSDTSVDIWNGTDWTTVSVPSEDTDINTYGFAQSADVAWESTGDRALFVWRDGTTSETALRYMVYDRGSNAFQEIDNNVNCLLTEGGAGTTETVTALANAMDSGGPCSGLGTWAGVTSGIKLAADPNSSEIMLVAANQATTAILPEAQLWNGDANGTWLTQTATMGALTADGSPGTFPTATAPYRAYDFAWRISGADSTGVLAYDEDGANVDKAPHYRTWSGTDFSSELDQLDYITNTSSEATFHILKAAPTRDEYMGGRLTSDGHLNIQMWDGDSWEYGSGAPDLGEFTKSILSTNAGNRAFDIAYEQTSGDAMVVYEDTATANETLKYRTWNGSTWSSEQTLDYSAVAEGNDNTATIEMSARSGGDEIMLGWQDKTGLGIYGAVWDGSTWQDISLINGAGVTVNQQSFDLAWEGTSDQGMILYGTGTTTDYSVYDISGSAWTDGSGSVNPAGAAVWVRLDSDPSSDYIAAIIIDTVSTTSADIQVDIWNGSDWTTVAVPTADTDINTYGFAQGADVAWEQNNSNGRALFVWRNGIIAGTTTAETSLSYMVYNRTANAFQEIDDNSVCLLTEGGAGTTETVTSMDNNEDSGGPCNGLGTWAGTVSGIRLNPDPSSNIIAVLGENETTLDVRPEMQLWNGDANGSWLTQTATMGAFEVDAALGTLPTATMSNLPYAFAFNKYYPSPTVVQTHYRWRSDDGNETSGSSLVSEDTAYTSMSKSTTYRLRFSINNSGAGSATSYTYRLEYAAKSGGSCGDDESFAQVPDSPTSEPFDMTLTSNYADSDSSTNAGSGPGVMSDPGGSSFTAGKLVESTSNSTSAITLATNTFTEIEYSFQANSNATDSGNYCFRVTNAGSALDTYSVYPEVTIAVASGYQTPALVQSTSNTGVNLAVKTLAKAFSSNVATGDLIVVAASTWNSASDVSVTSVTDSAGNNYSLAVEENTGVVTYEPVSIWYAANVIGGAITVTVHTANATNNPNITMGIHEYSGIATSNPLDVTNHHTATGTSVTSNSATTTQSTELIFGGINHTANSSTITFSAGTNFNGRVSIQDNSSTEALWSEDKVVTSTGSYDASGTMSTSVEYQAAMATFKAAASSGPTNDQLMRHGKWFSNGVEQPFTF